MKKLLCLLLLLCVAFFFVLFVFVILGLGGSSCCHFQGIFGSPSIEAIVTCLHILENFCVFLRWIVLDPFKKFREKISMHILEISHTSEGDEENATNSGVVFHRLHFRLSALVDAVGCDWVAPIF